MKHVKLVRVIKRERRSEAGQSGDACPSPAPEATANAREMRDVVSGWVREHHHRSEEFRRNYSTLLRELGFTAPRAGVAV
jgi:hypothetical protein